MSKGRDVSLMTSQLTLIVIAMEAGSEDSLRILEPHEIVHYKPFENIYCFIRLLQPR